MTGPGPFEKTPASLPPEVQQLPRGDVLLPYQGRATLLATTAQLLVIEKSRRIGLTWGLAAHAGVDFKMENDWFFGVDARWMDIDSDVSVNLAQVGTVNIDPIVYGFYFGKRF